MGLSKKFLAWCGTQFQPFFPPSACDRYAYSDDGSEEFDKDDTNLTLIKPSSLPSNDVHVAPETRPLQGSNGSTNSDLEEDKTE